MNLTACLWTARLHHSTTRKSTQTCGMPYPGIEPVTHAIRHRCQTLAPSVIIFVLQDNTK